MIRRPRLSRSAQGGLRSLVERFRAWVSRRVGPLGGRERVDWVAYRPLFARVTAHLSIIALVLTAVFLGSAQSAGKVLGAETTFRPAFSPVSTPSPSPQAIAWRPSPPIVLSRQAQIHTVYPDRPRTTVITYTVQPGDTIFGIAQKFGLTPHTIYWANSDVLHDNPHLLWPGMVLNILPVNGVYHTVEAGETVASIAEKYNVDPEVIYNEWNDLERGQPLEPGMKLVIPGGTREFLVWQLPKYSNLRGAAAVGSGVCALPSIGLRGNGWFIWPTDGRRISGWTFHDPRNPPHAGIDIGLRTGDPVYAADNGVVAYAGWNDWGYGYLIVLDHGNGFQTYYAHLSAIWVVCGQSVYQGTPIGAGGSTGHSTGPHLHFEIRYEGVPQDPLYYLP